jgi:TATA-binding protein-associated factor
MESIKREENEILQKMAAESLAYLMSQTVNRQPSPNIKIVTNLCTLLKSDEEFTPTLTFCDRNLSHFKPNGDVRNPYYGIITLQTQQRTKEAANGSHLSAAGPSRGPGRPPALEASLKEVNETDDPVSNTHPLTTAANKISICSLCRLVKPTRSSESARPLQCSRW